jgi:hypothetical protein
MYESSNELLKLTQNSSVHIQTHARIHTQYTPRVEQFCGRCSTTTKRPPGGGGTDAVHNTAKNGVKVCAATAGPVQFSSLNAGGES